MKDNMLTKRSQYSSMEEAIEKIKQATLSLKSTVDKTVDYLKSCEDLVKLDKKLGMDKFMEHLVLTAELKNINYYLQLAIVDMLRFEHEQ